MRYLIYLILCIPLLYISFSDKESVATNENRSLQAFPQAPKDLKDAGRFFSEMNKYFNDHFIERAIIIKSFTTAKYNLGISPHDRHVLGKDDWIFCDWDHLIQQHKGLKKLSAKQAKNTANVIKTNAQHFKKRGIPFLFTIAPNKLSIYPEYFPNNIKITENPNVNMIKQNLKGSNVNTLDLKDCLLKRKDSSPHLLYYRTDSHWNYTGAYYAYRELMKNLKKHFPRIRVLKDKDLKVNKYKKLFVLKKTMSIFNNLSEKGTQYMPAKKIKSEEKKVKKHPESHKRILHVKTKNKGPKLLLIRDSYSDILLEYYKYSFSEIFVVHHRWGDWYVDETKQFNPDVVIFETVERFLGIPFIPTKFGRR